MDDSETKKDRIKLVYLGHACFVLDDSLVIDPYKDGSVPGLAPLRVKANKVICTHQHADHSGKECVEILPKESDFKIKEVPSWHDDQEGALRGPNTIFIIEKNGEKIVHLGDLGHFPNDTKLEKIRDADYLLIPVGGFFTIDAKTAIEICQAANPKCIIPMHYRTATSGYNELATVDEFLALADNMDFKNKIKVMKKE